MSAPVEIRTERLLLRHWREDDRAPFAEMNADQRVMEHFPSTLDLAGSNSLVDRIESDFDRLGYACWRQGYETEAAKAVLEVGCEDLHFDEIVSFTVPENVRSRRVMERIGMSHDPSDDFDHPRFAKGHRCCRHVLYRISPSR